MIKKNIHIVVAEGEGQHIEFKEGLSRLDREIVAFANACGGSIFIGVADNGKIVGTDISNRMQSAIQDIAHNCDPTITIQFAKHEENVLEVIVPEGDDKPYRCKEGFYTRVGPSAVKLRRDEIALLIMNQGRFHFDELYNEKFNFNEDFDKNKLKHFLELCKISINADDEDLLLSLDCAKSINNSLRLNNASILLFAKEPQRFFLESYVTCVLYAGNDRTVISDRKDFRGDLITLIEESISFILRHTSKAQRISSQSARRQDIYDYPPVAIREAIVNAIMHRDYYNDSSHVFVHLFSDRLEIENPGGLITGLKIEELGERSVRRNRMVADLLYRSGYAEKIGSGIQRIKKALVENQNPPFHISSTNYFVIVFYPRVNTAPEVHLTERQTLLLREMEKKGSINIAQAANAIYSSSDTALRELRTLIVAGIVTRTGSGRAIRYAILLT